MPMTSDLTGGWAKAVEQTSAAAKEVLVAFRGLGCFLSPAFKPLVGIAADHFEVWRAERRMRLNSRFETFLRERGLSSPTREVAPTFLLPLLEHAGVEADDDLQDVWAEMLANAADANSDTERRTAFIGILKELSIFDVKILSLIHEIAPTTENGIVYTGNFPDSKSQKDDGHRPSLTREDVAVSLGNLARLGCISLSPAIGGVMVSTHVQLTPLGKAFIKSCTRDEI